MANRTGKGGKKFVKGQSGNPGGRPKALVNVTELARAQTEATIATLVEIRDGHIDDSGTQQVQAAARVAASKELLDRGWGRPPQFSTDKAGEFRQALDMSDDELDARIAAAERLVELTNTAEGSKELH